MDLNTQKFLFFYRKVNFSGKKICLHQNIKPRFHIDHMTNERNVIFEGLQAFQASIKHLITKSTNKI